MSDAKQARGWTRQQIRRESRATRPVIGLGAAGTVLGIGQAGTASAILARCLRHHPAPVPLLILFAALALFRAGLMLLSDRAAHRASAGARQRLRADALDRILQSGPALLRGQHSAALAGAVVDRVEALDGLFSRWAPAAKLALISPLLVLIALAPVDPWAACVLAGAGLLVPLAMALSGLGAAAASRRQFRALTHLQARFLDRVRGIATIVIANQTEHEARALAAAARDLRRRTMRVLRMAFLSSAALDCAAAFAVIAIALHFGLAIAHGTGVHGMGSAFPHPGRALYALLLVPEFFAPLRAYSAAYQDRMHAGAAAEALIALPPIPEPPAALPIRTVSAHGVTVCFEEVVLRPDPTRPPALDRLSFRVPAGETLVIAGPSGAGKSSVFEILLGFATPESGRVTINGAELASIVPAALSRMTAWIGQRPVIFAGSIADNIRFARPDAADKEVAEAARAALVDQFAENLPEGLDTSIGEGGFGLSGGQAQRIAIARAFLKNAPLLLLDEPTTHLDPATERDVLESLRRLAMGRTVILASHSAAAQAFAAHHFGGKRLDIADGRAMPPRGIAQGGVA